MEKEELYDMCRNILDLHRQRFIILKNEIENIIESDSEMLNVLHRKEYLVSLLQHTKIEIEASLNSFNIHH